MLNTYQRIKQARVAQYAKRYMWTVGCTEAYTYEEGLERRLTQM